MDKQQILQIIGQLEASIDKIDEYLDLEDFKEYCDSISVAITYWRVELKKLNDAS